MMRGGILAALIGLVGLVAALPASGQGICPFTDSCCQKQRGGMCIRSQINNGVPVEQWNDVTTTAGGLRYVLKPDERQRRGYTFGLATHDNDIKVRPVCEERLPLVREEYVACRTGSTLTVYHQTGRKIAEVANSTAFDTNDFAPGGYIAYHGDVLMARQDTGEGKRYVIVDQTSGKTVLVPADAVILNWIRFVWQKDYDAYINQTGDRPLDRGAAQVLAVPVGEVQLGPGLGTQPIFHPLADDGAPMALPDGVRGVVRTDAYRQPLGYAVVKDSPAGRRYLLSAKGPRAAIAESASLESYLSLDRTTTGAAPKQRFYTAATTEDGAGVVTEYWANTKVIHEGGTSGTEALAQWRSQRDAAMAATQAEISARITRERAEREAAEAAEAARVAGLRSAAEKCHAVLVAAIREGRWSEIDEASRTYGLRNEGWVRAGLIPGDPGACNDYYRPAYTATFENSDLLQLAPVSDLVAAARIEPNVDAKRAMFEAARKRGETSMLIELAQLYRASRQLNDAWAAYAEAARAGNGAGYYFMGEMELPSAPHNRPGRTNYADHEENLEFYNYVLGYYSEAEAAGYEPAKARIQWIWERIFDYEEKIENNQRADYYRNRANLWRTCVRGGTPGYEFTCYTDSQGRRVSPYTGMPY